LQVVKNVTLQLLLRMVVDMDIQIKQRLYITTVAITLLWLLCMGVVNLLHVQDIRALALSDCIEQLAAAMKAAEDAVAKVEASKK